MIKFNEYFYRLEGKDSFVQKNHFHNEIEFIHVVNGNGTVLKNDKTYIFNPQNIYVVDARNAHIVYPQFDDCHDYVRNKIVVDADSFMNFCDIMGFSEIIEKLFNSAPISTVEAPQVDEIFKKINIMCTQNNKEDYGFAHGEIIKLIYWLKSNCEDSANNMQNSTIQKILNIIAEKDSITSLTEISYILHLDKYYICHLFKNKTGKNLSDYISDKLFEKSRKLLIGTDYPIEEISLICGFSSVSSFSRFFKNKCGVSPLMFRKKNNTRIDLKF